jgi:hypothetical protein
MDDSLEELKKIKQTNDQLKTDSLNSLYNIPQQYFVKVDKNPNVSLEKGLIALI